MAIDLSAIKVKPTVMPKRAGTKASRDLGPNHWLDKAMPGGLWESYETATAFEAELPGEYRTATYTKGKDKGKEYDKLFGEAADAETLIRDAAELFGIGVSVRISPAVVQSGPNKGKPKPGVMVVQWQGQKRKEYKPRTPAAPEATPETSQDGASQ